MELDLLENGNEYISASRAAEKTGYTSDYIGQLSRAGKIPAKLIGRTWYVDFKSLLKHKRTRQLGRGKTKKTVFENTLPETKTPQVLLESTPSKISQSTELIFESDARPLLPQLSRPNVPVVVETGWDLSLGRKVAALSLSVLLFAGASAMVMKNDVPALSQGASASLFDSMVETAEFFVSGFKNLKTLALSKLNPVRVANDDPRFTAPAVPTTISTAAGEVSVAITETRPAYSLEGLKGELRTELEAYIQARISGVSPVAVYNSSPVYNNTFRNEILLADTRPTVTRQSSSDIDEVISTLRIFQTEGVLTNTVITNGQVSGPSGSFDAFAWGSATGTSATTTDFYSTNATFQNIVGSALDLTSLVFSRATGTAATTTNFYSTSLFADTASSTNLFSTNGSISALTANTLTVGSFTGGQTSLSGLLVSGSTTLQDFTAQNSTSSQATTTNFFSTRGTFDELYVNDYQQNNGTFIINSTVPTGNIFEVRDTAVTSGTLIHQSLTANAGNGQTSYGQVIDLVDSTVAGGGYSAFSINVTGSGVGSGSKTLLSLSPGGNNEVVFDSTGALRPTTDSASNTNSIGSPSFYWKNGYFDTITANNLSGTVVTGATSNDTWTVGSTEAGDDLKALIFQRNSGSGNSTLSWNSGANDLRYLSVNYPFNATYTISDASISTTASLYSGALTNNTTSGTQRLLSISNTGTGTTENGIYINNTGTGTTALEIAGTWTNGLLTNDNTINTGSGDITSTGTGTFGNILANGSTTLQNFTALNSTSTNATTTSLFSTGGRISSLFSESLSFTSTSNAGLQLNNLTTGERDLLTPSLGSTIYNTSVSKMQVYNGDWKNVGNPEIGSEVTGGTGSSVLFVDGSGNLAQDNTNFTWNDSLNKLTTLNLDSTNSTSTNATSTNLYFSNSLTGPGSFMVNAGGSVGIGTTNPSLGKLQVADGNIVISGSGSSFLGVGPQALNVGHSGFFDLNFQTNGLTRMTVEDGGNVGIGTTNPSSALHIVGGIASGAQLILSSATADATLKDSRIGAQHYTNAEEPLALIAGRVDGTTSQVFVGGGRAEENAATSIAFFTAANHTTTTGTERLRIDSSGNVGIGTSNPGYALDVQASAPQAALTATTGTNLAAYRVVNTGGTSWFGNESSAGGSILPGSTAYATVLTTNSRPLQFGTANTVRMTLDASGNVGIGTTNPGASLEVIGNVNVGDATNSRSLNIAHATVPEISIQVAGSEKNVLSRTSDYFGIYDNTGGAWHTVFKDGGNVGIGTTNPSQKLEVNGNIIAKTGSNAGFVQTYTIQSTGGWNAIRTNHANPSLVLAYDADNSNTKGNLDVGNGNLYVMSTGNVGIGTTTPQALFHVNKTGSNEVAVITNTGSDPYLTVGPNSNAGGFVRWNTTDSTIQLGHHSFSGGGGINVNSSGNVGIGTTTSNYNLEVAGTFKTGSATTTFSATGGTITTSGSYTIHTFTSSGTFTPNGPGTVEYLIVGGGGAGGMAGGGGGGAGGVATGTGHIVTGQTYDVAVGSGGLASVATFNVPGGNGASSSFDGIVAAGGGGGGSYPLSGASNGSAGGSGGGGAGTGSSQPPGTGGAASPSGQGSAGGNGWNNGANNSPGGGGGGAGAVGGNASVSLGGAGGAGVASSISGSSVTYAGGGGGGEVVDAAGSGGAGGGGSGVGNAAGQNGTANTGGGGGGGSYDGGNYWKGGNGGSGIIIIRYLTASTVSLDGMVTTNTGRVGIGTTTPQFTLSVNGTIEGASTFQSQFGANLRLNTGSSNKDIFMQSNGSTLMAVKGATGYVGIGTTNPGAPLEVLGSNGQQMRISSTAHIAANQYGMITSCVSGIRAITAIGSNAGFNSTCSPVRTDTSTYGWFAWLDNANDIFAVQRVNTSGSNIGMLRLDGSGNLTIKGSLTQNGSPDIAENIKVTDSEIEAGDVVMVDPSYLAPAGSDIYNVIAVTKASSTGAVLGVISTNPGIILNGVPGGAEATASSTRSASDERPLALAGRVPVKFSNENGEVEVGDRLTPSLTIPGYAMKMTKSGQSIGIALEGSSGASAGKVLMFVNIGYEHIAEGGDFTSIELFTNIWNLIVTKLADAANGITEIIAGTFRAKNQLCINDTCITEAQLQALLLNAGQDINNGNGDSEGEDEEVLPEEEESDPGNESPIDEGGEESQNNEEQNEGDHVPEETEGGEVDNNEGEGAIDEGGDESSGEIGEGEENLGGDEGEVGDEEVGAGDSGEEGEGSEG